MVWVRKAFGFILLAMAAYFLKNLLPGPLAYPLTLALILLLAGIYLAWIDSVPNAGRVFAFIRNIVGVLFFIAALYVSITGIHSVLKTMERPSGKAGAVAGIQWISYSEENLRQAAVDQKPIFIDFFADWCAPCKELDDKTFSTPEIIQRSSQFRMFKVDLTSADNAQAKGLREKYQIRGVPTLMFLHPDGREIPGLRGTGFESKEIFLDKMNQALKAAAASDLQY
jgi:thiol:disulfide interchange protein DsbD